ncbi:WXG100 family type VII secretion target [Kitasatospora azatica]|uniref:WXG100 family type VII secretion target n=1 Tax=Kitasatospora azatica TaxID=58347 RepID=UPI0005675E9E|nr:WXG100 family type VII secretion target [Kitasatospora azatica]
MTDRLVVDFGSMDQLHTGLGASADRLEEWLTDLDQALERIARSWQGEAHDAFYAAFAHWRGTSRELHADLRKLHELTGTAHGNYRAAQSANRAIWRNV